MPDTFTPANLGPASAPRVESGQGAVLAAFGRWRPPATMTVPIAERVRYALMRSCSDAVPWQVSGKDGNGRPRVGHRHLYILPFNAAGSHSGEIDRVLLWAHAGLERETVELLEVIAERGAWLQVAGHPRLRLEVLSMGGGGRTLIGPARVWRSVTPFIPPRYCRVRRGRLRETPEQQLAALVRERVGVAPVDLEPLAGDHWHSFVQQQRHHARRPGASGWTLRFSEPVRGPLVIGGDSHVGLGRFEAVV